MESQDLARILIDPYYAINVDPTIASEHQPIVSKAQWLKANVQLIEELGSKQWLVYLLSILEGDFPRNPDEAALLVRDPDE